MSQEKGSEVLIIGAGVIGLSIARALHKRGFGSITVLDRSQPGREASFAAAGMLAPQAEADRADDFFRLCQDSNRMYPDFAGELLEETGIDIEFDDEGTLYLAFTEHDLVELNRRWEWQRSAGLSVEKLSAEETRRLEPFVSADALGSLFFPEDRQVENRLLVRSLLTYAARNCINVTGGSEAEELVLSSGRAGGTRCSNGEFFEAETVIVAAGAWTSRLKGLGIGSGVPEIRPVRGQMLSFRASEQLFRKVIYSARGYIVPRRHGRILAGATSEDVGFADRVTDDGIDSVLSNAIEISPRLANQSVDESWSGLRPYCDGGRPFIGPVSGCEGLYAAVGHYRNGILLAPITGEIVGDMICGAKATDFPVNSDASAAGAE